MKDRIKHYIEHKGITAGELAVILDVQQSNISHILNGRNKPGAVFIEKLLIAFPDLNARWLLTGEGVMNEELQSQTKVPNTLPFTVEPDVELEPEHKSETKPKDVKEERQPASNVQFPASNIANDDVEKMILLFKDGTFATYKNRDSK